jgi:hypothetical protein
MQCNVFFCWQGWSKSNNPIVKQHDFKGLMLQQTEEGGCGDAEVAPARAGNRICSLISIINIHHG